MNLKDGEVLRCPKCGCDTFFATAHVAQDWEIDEHGTFVRCKQDCTEVDHYPDEDDVIDCARCGYSSSGSDFITTKQAISAKARCHEDFPNVIEEEKYLMGEIIFDITTCVRIFTGVGAPAEDAEYDSRDLYASIFEWAKEFEKKYPDPGFDYMILVEEFACAKLREYFELEG